MGVTYKIKDDVLQYILQRKKDSPKVSCQDISDEILTKFEVKVSKSSVYDALKEAGLIKPKERKVKDTFALPTEAKTTIQTAIIKAAADLLPANPIPPPETALSLMPDVAAVAQASLAQQIEEAPKVEEKPQEVIPVVEIIREANFPHAGDIILKTLIREMGIKDGEVSTPTKDPFNTFLVCAYKLVFENGKTIYIDAQFQGIAEQFHERKWHKRFLGQATIELCDRIVNGIKPLIINDLGDNLLKIELEGLLATEGALRYACLVDKDDQAIVGFDCPKRERVVLSLDNPITVDFDSWAKNDVNSIESIAYNIFGKNLTEEQFMQVISLEGFITKTGGEKKLNLIYQTSSSIKEEILQIITQLNSLMPTTKEGDLLDIIAIESQYA